MSDLKHEYIINYLDPIINAFDVGKEFNLIKNDGLYNKESIIEYIQAFIYKNSLLKTNEDHMCILNHFIGCLKGDEPLSVITLMYILVVIDDIRNIRVSNSPNNMYI